MPHLSHKTDGFKGSLVKFLYDIMKNDGSVPRKYDDSQVHNSGCLAKLSQGSF